MSAGCTYILLNVIHDLLTYILCVEISYPSSIDSSNISIMVNHIRIYHECEGRIEKSISRIAVWHHEACQVMRNSDPNGQIFLSPLRQIMNSFSCSPLFLFIYLF